MKKLIVFAALIYSFHSNQSAVYDKTWNKEISYSPANGMVPDEATAKKIAEAIWLPIYGDAISSEKPYKAKLLDGRIWVIEGILPAGRLGGVAYIEIQKSDCKISKVIHGK